MNKYPHQRVIIIKWKYLLMNREENADAEREGRRARNVNEFNQLNGKRNWSPDSALRHNAEGAAPINSGQRQADHRSV